MLFIIETSGSAEPWPPAAYAVRLVLLDWVAS
jgi:hypothetical protein